MLLAREQKIADPIPHGAGPTQTNRCRGRRTTGRRRTCGC
jgi:hypothetical protein